MPSAPALPAHLGRCDIRIELYVVFLGKVIFSHETEHRIRLPIQGHFRFEKMLVFEVQPDQDELEERSAAWLWKTVKDAKWSRDIQDQLRDQDR